MNKKKYVKPEITFVKLNPAQAVLTVCSTAAAVSKAGGGGATCRGTGGPAKCKKLGVTGDSGAAC